jgi:hypothetical protein
MKKSATRANLGRIKVQSLTHNMQSNTATTPHATDHAIRSTRNFITVRLVR